MVKLLLGILILSTVVVTLARPWVGVTAYYLLAVLGPQYIWWWHFQGLRVSFIVAISVILGVGLSIIKNRYDQAFIFNKLSLWIVLLWLSIVVSYLFGPYTSDFPYYGLGTSRIFSITNTIFFFYFLAVVEMNELRKLRYLAIIFVVSTIYMTYWANLQYFSQNWWQFNMGRLMGPVSIDGSFIYGDSNAFALLFVCGIPFIYYLSFELKKNWLRWAFWAIIPLGWHAIFLTGSRGGLLGISVTMVAILMLSQRKILAVPLIALFFIFYQWQAGDIMLERSDQILNIDEEQSATDRLTAWKGGVKMVLSHPLTGVGLGGFVLALPDYVEDGRNMVAHNTFVQFLAESGLGAGLAYLIIVILFFKQARYIRRWCREKDADQETQQIGLYNAASIVSFSGLFVCGLFLSLNTYEIFFVLLLFNNGLYQICLKKNHHVQPVSKIM